MFPYYKVYFKLSSISAITSFVSSFHTIKSILNYNALLSNNDSFFKFPYYKVYFKPALGLHKYLKKKGFHTIKSILNWIIFQEVKQP